MLALRVITVTLLRHTCNIQNRTYKIANWLTYWSAAAVSIDDDILHFLQITVLLHELNSGPII